MNNCNARHDYEPTTPGVLGRECIVSDHHPTVDRATRVVIGALQLRHTRRHCARLRQDHHCQPHSLFFGTEQNGMLGHRLIGPGKGCSPWPMQRDGPSLAAP